MNALVGEPSTPNALPAVNPERKRTARNLSGPPDRKQSPSKLTGYDFQGPLARYVLGGGNMMERITEDDDIPRYGSKYKLRTSKDDGGLRSE